MPLAAGASMTWMLLASTCAPQPRAAVQCHREHQQQGRAAPLTNFVQKQKAQGCAVAPHLVLPPLLAAGLVSPGVLPQLPLHLDLHPLVHVLLQLQRQVAPGLRPSRVQLH